MQATIGNQQVNISSKMYGAICALAQSGKGQFATVSHYVTSTGEESSINFTSRFSYEALNDRKVKALNELNPSSFSDATTFEISKNAMLESIQKTKEGDRSDAHRQGHDTFYIRVCEGVRVHLETIKEGGETKVVLGKDGLPNVDAIMVEFLEIKREVHKEGVHKVVKHGKKVAMDHEIEKKLKEMGVRKLKTLSLKDDNFEELRIQGETISL